MKQSCLTRQPTIVDLGNGKYQFIYDQQEIQRPDSEDPQDTMFLYDFVETPSAHSDDILRALIHKVYTIDDEIALINNYEMRSPDAVAQYEAYQAFRQEMKVIVSETLSE